MSQMETLSFSFSAHSSSQRCGKKRWTTKWDLDFFSKKMLFIPIHKDFHWPLCIVCNAEYINSCDCVEENTSLR
jgi:Ulp1 family protease